MRTSPNLFDMFSYPLLCRFRWVFCQLEVLRHCLPASIRQTLDQLPESLDETYLRVLSQIPQANQAHAHRMLQCLMVAVRPLRVEELAELLAFEFDSGHEGIPKYRAAWRLDDQTQAVLSTCSSLVTIVGERWYGQIVQFSHFSVKEFLISNRLGDFSRYYICPVSAHTILTQACLGFLLHLNNHIDGKSANIFPLANYAAQYWVEHARFEDVALRVKHGMEILFDPSRPHFAAWIRIYDMDDPSYFLYGLGDWGQSYANIAKPNPLYYAVLSGFYDLVKHLAIKHPQHVNALGGQYRFPLFAALRTDHLEVLELLLEHGANVNALDAKGETVLLNVLSSPPQHYVNINVPFGNSKTPLYMLAGNQIEKEDIVLNLVLLLLKHGAQVNTQGKDDKTPLLLAMWRCQFKLAKILLQHGADPNVGNNGGKAALYQRENQKSPFLTRLLSLNGRGVQKQYCTIKQLGQCHWS